MPLKKSEIESGPTPNVGGEKKLPAWQKIPGVEGLYLMTATGGYFSRYRLNGKRTFRTLETTILTVAKLRHKQRVVEIEEDRQRGATISAEFQQLGELAVEVMSRVNASNREEGSKRAVEGQIIRLRENWQRSEFDSFHVRHVSHEVLFELREQLRTHAKVRTSRRWNTGKVRAKLGFADTVVNQTMWCLRQMLEIAVEKRVIIENPFATTGTLRESVLLRAKSKRRDLPRREDVEAMFLEMRRVPDTRGVEQLEGEAAWKAGYAIAQLANSRQRAGWVADHAQFLALTGARLEEGNASRIEDDRGETLLLRGTKSESSERFIPVHPQLRLLLNRLKKDSKGGVHFLNVHHSLAPMGRACARLGIRRFTHHDLRHYYATICIESGVDIPTVSRWLGHGDGGALCMETYGHLRDEHSLHMGKRVDFRSRSQLVKPRKGASALSITHKSRWLREGTPGGGL